MISPVDEVDMAFLIIEWIEGDIKLTGGNKFATRYPVNYSIAGNSNTKSLEKHLVIYCLGTVCNMNEGMYPYLINVVDIDVNIQ